ncbi:hypothetical protein [Sphingomonas sp. CCH5-D11]|uniref:hypothetical protein n=1 Tax=Sphingomonas sp. CCH5-D11 TaxID=1768786 RepID=UPI000A71081A|nr:hypothetical protein [Sphingomonas sp. CCH5-D11]
MPDPGNALPLYQQALAAGTIPLQTCGLDRLFMVVDQRAGKTCLSYRRVAGTTITMLDMFAHKIE